MSFDGILEFLEKAEGLKNTLRSAWSSQGRAESVAEHTWRLCLMAMLFEDQYPEIDLSKLMKMCVIHDLGEIIGGDIPAIEQDPKASKSGQERIDLQEILKPLPARTRQEYLALWDAYEHADCPEAKIAKALDKLETMMQHNQGDNPESFDYDFNLAYGNRYTDAFEWTRAIRKKIDQKTAERSALKGSGTPSGGKQAS